MIRWPWDVKQVETVVMDRTPELTPEIEAALTKLHEDMTRKMWEAIAPRLSHPRPTALMVKADGSFEVVDLDDDGKVIERCRKCGPILLCSDCMSKVT